MRGGVQGHGGHELAEFVQDGIHEAAVSGAAGFDAAGVDALCAQRLLQGFDVGVFAGHRA